MQNYHQMTQADAQRRQEDLENKLEKVKYSSRKNLTENKKNWYKIGKRILQKFPVKLHPESKTSAR